MRSIAKPSVYLSSYPLTAVKQSNINKPDSPYLRALLSGASAANNGTTGRVRKLSLANPQPIQKKQVQTEKNKLPTDIELTEKDWFKNYE